MQFWRPLTSLCVAAFFLLYSTLSFASQAPQRAALGALYATGEVTVNNARIAGESTLFSGDVLRTGDGEARATFSGRGSLVVSPHSQITFAPVPAYFATLDQGGAEWRALAESKNFQLRLGNPAAAQYFTVVQYGQDEAAAVVQVVPDGSASIQCTAGSIAIIQMNGPQSLFISAGKVGSISAAGVLQAGEAQAAPVAPAAKPAPAPPEAPAPSKEAAPAKAEAPPPQAAPPSEAPSPTTPPPTTQPRTPSTPKVSHAHAYLALGLIGGGIAGLAAALAGRGGSRPSVSPSLP